MKAAIVRGDGQTPVYGEFSEPAPTEGESRIAVTAAAISQVVKSRASGAHYGSSGELPFVAGIDGVGRLDDGNRVYFIGPRAPHGSMAERTVAPSTQCLALPDDLDDVTAAAIANPGMSSWAAYTERARLKAGETVLVNGASGTSGRLAVQIARHLGAKKVIATARNAEALKAVAALGADLTIPLVEDQAQLQESLEQQFAQGVDVVIDYLCGKSAERLLIAGAKAGKDAVPIRFVQIFDRFAPSFGLASSAISNTGSYQPDSNVFTVVVASEKPR
jgi:NADPH:quinone reductase-like Zn-dependent oxidoreductase